jgi:uncharacterized protein with PIN domain
LKFVVDGMLGSFTRWLRLLGYEAEYFKGSSDEFLLERAASLNATLLTRDEELFRRARARGLQAFFVEGDDEVERLSSVAGRFGLRLDVDEVLSRCPTCGSSLKRVDIDEVLDRVPKGTLRHYSEFWGCTGCGKVYWRGGHWKKINETLERARKLLHASEY